MNRISTTTVCLKDVDRLHDFRVLLLLSLGEVLCSCCAADFLESSAHAGSQRSDTYGVVTGTRETDGIMQTDLGSRSCPAADLNGRS